MDAADTAVAKMEDAANKMAAAAKSAGIMIVFQGDLGFDVPETEEVDESRLPGRDGYGQFLDKLIEETKAFAGQVVIVHGDTHFFKIDKPLATATSLIPNLTRVQTFGSPNVHWIKVSVDTSSRDVFSFHPMIVPGN